MATRPEITRPKTNIMKKISITTTLTLFLFLTSFVADKKFDTPTDLGQEMFELIKSKNLKGLQNLIVTGGEMSATIDNSGQTGPEITSFKEQMIAKIDGEKDKTKEGITKSYEKIVADIDKKKCGKSIQIGKITPTTSKLKNYPIELGQVEVEYKCGAVTEKFTVEIINTSNGWRIMEKLRLVYKEQ